MAALTRLEPPPSRRGALTVAISRPPRAPQSPNGHQSEGAAERPADHTAGTCRGPARSAHATHTPACAAGVHGRARAPVAVRRRRNGRCAPLEAPDGGPVGGASATRRRRTRLRARRGRGGSGRACYGLRAGAARRQRRWRRAALTAVSRRARMCRFDFSHVLRTSLVRPRRAAEKLPGWRPSARHRWTVRQRPRSHLRTHTGTPARVRIGPMGVVGAEFERWGRT